jgi:acetyltransferase-like isoleucine patch superfamily enzyme
VRGLPRVRALLHGHSPLQISYGPGVHIKRGSRVKYIGSAYFDQRVSITARGGAIIFGDNFHSNEQVIFNADVGGTLAFGSNCLVGPRCIFRTANHRFDNVQEDIIDQGHECSDITIGDDVWFGAGVIVLPGVTIGSHSVIGAGSVVTKDIPAFSVAFGTPAVVIRSRK